MKRVALFFDRTYVDAHACFTELARHLARDGYSVDLYCVLNPHNPPPNLYEKNVRVYPFPLGGWQQMAFWTRLLRTPRERYDLCIGTPMQGVFLCRKVQKIFRTPYLYLADEIFDPAIQWRHTPDFERQKEADIQANQGALATIALGEARYHYQQRVNSLSAQHPFFIIPNAPAGPAVRLKSNYFRDRFDLHDGKPIVLFIGTLHWLLAKKLFEATQDYVDKPFHLVFHGRTKGMMSATHPFIHMSDQPLPSDLMHYAVSSADVGLVLYDKSKPKEVRNGATGGKIGTYLKAALPLIAGNLEEFKAFEEADIGIYWDGEEDFDACVARLLPNLKRHEQKISAAYSDQYNYTARYMELSQFLRQSLK